MIDEIPDYNSSYLCFAHSRYFENACRKTEGSFLLLRIVDTKEGKGWQKKDHSLSTSRTEMCKRKIEPSLLVYIYTVLVSSLLVECPSG